MKRQRRPIVAGGVVKGGRVLFDDARLVTAALNAWHDERITVTISQEEQSRSARANAYYHAVVLKLMASESGYSPDDLHEILKMRHNSKLVVDPKTGEEVRIAQTTTKLSIQQFSDYIEACMLDGAEWLGISFPEPRRHEEYREGRAA